MMEQVEALPEVVAGVEAGLPGLAAPAADASWLLPAAPKECGPAAASAELRSCEEEACSSVTQTQTKVILKEVFNLQYARHHSLVSIQL